MLRRQENFRDEAIKLFHMGFRIIPLIPGTKRTSVKWDPWLDQLNEQSIKSYWSKHPLAEIGAIVPSYLIVLDADSSQALMAIEAIESQTGIYSNCITKTKKGQHFFYRLPVEINVKTQSFSTEKEPEKIDVKANRSLIILPPSKNKSFKVFNINDLGDLPRVNAEFIELLNKQNGTNTKPNSKNFKPKTKNSKTPITLLSNLLKLTSSELSYSEWLSILMIIFHETDGSENGFRLADEWSSSASNYDGTDDLYRHWESFNAEQATPVTLGTLITIAKGQGASQYEINVALEREFEVLEHETIITDNKSIPHSDKNIELSIKQQKSSGLQKYSLRGQSADLASKLESQVFALPSLAIVGQATVFYAAPNTGKTLITLYLLLQSIEYENIKPENIYYLNMDDTARGIVEKATIFEDYQCHMLAEGHNGFSANFFESEIHSLIENDTAQGTVIILDTLKKFTDLMHKTVSAAFANTIRKFVMKGGTVIALAHTNKRKTKDGAYVHAGTSDIIEDFDCGYILKEVKNEHNQKIVEFENIKQRGNVERNAYFSYSTENGISYSELFVSVQKISESEIDTLKSEQELNNDIQIINAIKKSILSGTNHKMKIANEVAKSTSCSRKQAIKVIEKYTESADCKTPLWEFKIGARGAQVFSLLSDAQNT